MTHMNATTARQNFYKLVTQVNETHEPVMISSKGGNAVLLSEEDWRSVTETLHLLSIPGMRESIIKGMKTPIEDCEDAVRW